MTGFDLIKGMDNLERAIALNISQSEAQAVNLKSLEEMTTCEHICLETMNGFSLKGKCREKLFRCHDCRKEFLENEYTTSESLTD